MSVTPHLEMAGCIRPLLLIALSGVAACVSLKAGDVAALAGSDAEPGRADDAAVGGSAEGGPPTCQSAGFTGETNNLNLVSGSCCPSGGTTPGVQFLESDASGVTAQTCPLIGRMTDGVWRPGSSSSAQGNWYLSNINATNHTDVGPYTFGNGGDIPIVGDWNGDGVFTDGIFRPANSPNNPNPQAQWFLSNSNIANNTDIGPFFYGNAGDLPVTGDWDGDGKFGVGIFRPANSANNPNAQAQWFLSNSNIANNTDIGPFFYGNAGDLPVTGDWDGNGTYTAVRV